VSNFGRYSAYYDLLYRDKDYAAEAAYVAEAIRRVNPDARTILELGSGTGRHGRLLADMGFTVHGVERSAEMVEIAQAAGEGDGFSCELGDICALDLGRTFDAVISLFHVISYQTTDKALAAAFEVAARHLEPGGVFVFDVWHGPAVVAQKPEPRVKEVADAAHSVRRTARPIHDAAARTVNVVFDMDCTDFASGARAEFSEEHLMRYLFPEEIRRLAAAARLQPVASEEFLTGRPPSPDTWGVAYLMQR
jgi:SAM-dependent methyltransferase